MISASTYYELQLNTLHTDERYRLVSRACRLPDTVAINWAVNTIAFPNNNSPDRINYQLGFDQFNNQRSRTISFDGSFTSQLTRPTS
jgi:hypothetical protein